MSASEAFMKVQIEEMKKQLTTAQTAIANHARNALVALDEGDEDEVRRILNAIAGNEDTP